MSDPNRTFVWVWSKKYVKPRYVFAYLRTRANVGVEGSPPVMVSVVSILYSSNTDTHTHMKRILETDNETMHECERRSVGNHGAMLVDFRLPISPGVKVGKHRCFANFRRGPHEDWRKYFQYASLVPGLFVEVIFHEVFRYFDANDLIRLRQLSKTWHTACVNILADHTHKSPQVVVLNKLVRPKHLRSLQSTITHLDVSHAPQIKVRNLVVFRHLCWITIGYETDIDVYTYYMRADDDTPRLNDCSVRV